MAQHATAVLSPSLPITLPCALPPVALPQIVPEFSFLDARGVGELERLPLSEVAAALEAGDSLAPTWCDPLQGRCALGCFVCYIARSRHVR